MCPQGHFGTPGVQHCNAWWALIDRPTKKSAVWTLPGRSLLHSLLLDLNSNQHNQHSKLSLPLLQIYDLSSYFFGARFWWSVAPEAAYLHKAHASLWKWGAASSTPKPLVAFYIDSEWKARKQYPVDHYCSHNNKSTLSCLCFSGCETSNRCWHRTLGLQTVHVLLISLRNKEIFAPKTVYLLINTETHCSSLFYWQQSWPNILVRLLMSPEELI